MMSVLDQIQCLADQAARLCEQWKPGSDDLDEWDTLHEAVYELDEQVGPGLAVGKYLSFQVADGEALYIIDEIRDQVVHCTWIAADPDERQADAVDSNGWCLRSVAEQKIGRRENRR